LAGKEHAPLAESHEPVTWHSSSVVHEAAGPGTHTWLWQTSPSVQALPSLQLAPSGFGVHLPKLLGSLHEEQASLQAVSQQMPSTQKAPGQSVAAVASVQRGTRAGLSPGTCMRNPRG
jgi:hypothetical protein